MRSYKVVLLLTVVGLLLSSFAWAAEPAPVIGTVAYNAPGPGDVVNTELAAVYLFDDPHSEAWITIGSDQGLRPGAQVAFVRDGKQVACGTVRTVNLSDAIVTPAAGTPGGAIQRGDTVQVLANGSRKALDAQIRGQQQEEKLLSWALTALAIGLIFVQRGGAN